ncbi:cytochrome b561 [Marinobacter daqiaonensis]|uniref:Cytochrome b561 n=1 Tax=Marinobacter daqiaonensis TaxID=650891 RepID=A0A1I6HE35_9GAMM|nr:cytochrome b [Marinobacter daqiaonensis]SFR52719.1 cytochrome b561 [Marinobacter daqiaonensis]
MQLRTSDKRYGAVDMTFHWLVAVAVFALFGLGYWMVGLSYYNEWYRLAPHIHRSVGILLFGVILLRLLWRLVEIKPSPMASHSRFEVISARIAHATLYVLMLGAMISGYLISTADGSSIDVFGWFQVPSVTGRVERMEDVAGEVHYWATWALVVLAGIHGLAALKHHLFDRDDTLRRMLPVQLKDKDV